MAREYAKVRSLIWTGDTGRALRRCGAETQVVALYLLSAPSSNMIGLYYLAIPTLAHETGLTLEGASKALRSLSEIGFAEYDFEREEVWVVNMAREQVAESLKPDDNQAKGIRSELEKLRKSSFYSGFVRRYADAYHLNDLLLALPNARASEGPSKALRSQEQEQEQEQDIKSPPDSFVHSAKPEVDSPGKRRPTKPSPTAEQRDAVAAEWNRIADAAEAPNRRCQGDRFPSGATSAFKARVRDSGGFEPFLADFRDRAERILASAWHRGGSDRGWKADIGWLLSPKGWDAAMRQPHPTEARASPPPRGRYSKLTQLERDLLKGEGLTDVQLTIVESRLTSDRSTQALLAVVDSVLGRETCGVLGSPDAQGRISSPG